MEPIPGLEEHNLEKLFYHGLNDLKLIFETNRSAYRDYRVIKSIDSHDHPYCSKNETDFTNQAIIAPQTFIGSPLEVYQVVKNDEKSKFTLEKIGIYNGIKTPGRATWFTCIDDNIYLTSPAILGRYPISNRLTFTEDKDPFQKGIQKVIIGRESIFFEQTRNREIFNRIYQTLFCDLPQQP